MAENMIAIDFGTSRTKVAYFNPEMQQPELMRLGKEHSIPSYFNLDPESGKVWIGDAARERLEVNPMGHIPVLKNQLGSVRVGNHATKPEELLTHLFTEIREIAGRAIACFNGVSPTAVQLTFTYNYAETEKTILDTAATAAGFETVTLIPEPEAAARAWLATTPNPDSQSREVIVLDCGGGTVDWSYLQRTEDGRFRLMLPSRALDIGGETVDGALAEFVVSEKFPQEYALNQMDVLHTHCQGLKERYCRGLPLPSIKIEKDSHPVEVELEGSEIQEVIDNTFINPVCEAFKPYLDKVKEETNQDDPAILLVGGSAHLKGLAEGLERALSCQTFTWDRAEFAPVLGAALPVLMEQPALAPDGEEGQPEEAEHTETVYALTKPNVLQVAETFLTLAAENDEKSADVIRKKLEDYESEVFRLVMIGQIKKGKSSLINALLDEWELLPVETGVTTSTVYEVGYGDTPEFTVVFNPMADLDAAIPSEEVPPRKEKKIDASEITVYGTERGNPSNEKEVDFIRVQLPHPLLRDGVTLIDTPGLGGTYPQHNEITLRYAPNADAVCFVVDSAEAVVSLPELKRFEEFLEAPEKVGGVSRPPFFFVQTKMDANMEWEAFRAGNLASLSAHFDMPQEALRYFPVSATLKRQATATLSVESFDSEVVEESGFPALENFFREELLRAKEERSARKLLEGILDQTRAIHQKIAGELQLFQQTGPAELEELARQATDNESRFATWEQETYPQLVKDFNTRADRLRQDTLAQLKTALDAEETGPIVEPIIDALRSQELSRKELAEKSDALQQECVAKCQEVTLSILEQYQKKMRALLERTTAELGSSLEDVLIFPAISLTPHEGEGLADSTSLGEKVGAVGIAAGGAIAGDLLSAFLIKLPIGMALGIAGVGALTATIVLLPISLVAMAFGGRFALRKFRKGRQEAALNEVRRFLSEVVQHARTQLLQQFEESSKDIEDKVRDRLDSAKTTTAKDLASRRDSIADAQQQALEENQQTAAELEATVGQVAALLQRIKQMLGTETRANAMSNTP